MKLSALEMEALRLQNKGKLSEEAQKERAAFLRKLRHLRRNAKENGAGTAQDYLNLLEKWVLGQWTPKRGYIANCADCRKEARSRK